MSNTIFRAKTLLLALITVLCSTLGVFASEENQPKKESSLHEKPSEAPAKIKIQPKNHDQEISKRLESILTATNWFIDPIVTVENGVVFLTGSTKNHQFKDWAGNLAHNTQDVAAVVNKIAVQEPSIWDLHMILSELLLQLRKMLRALPSIIFGVIILFISWVIARFVYKLVPIIFRNKGHPTLLNDVIARAISFFVFLLGVYFIFEMAELTTMALTIISGTGILGLVIGIAFRDITENFLASILLSIQNPFQMGDFIDVVCPVTGYGATGYVDRLTLRVTILITPDGNHLQIPNATVYKSNIRNYSTNPNRREDFSISIGTEYSISRAEEVALKVLIDNQAILKDPEPLVLVDNLTKDLVNLRIYYWIDSRAHNWLKVKSLVIRLIKQAFQVEGINFPLSEISKEGPPTSVKSTIKETSKTASETESKLDSQKKENKGVSEQARLPEKGDNLLDSDNNKPKGENHS